MNLSLVWKALFYGWTASEIGLALFTRTRRSHGKVSDRGSLVVLWATILASITAGEFISAAQGRTFLASASWVRYAAIGLILAGLVVRWTAILSLGKAFSVNVAIRTTQTLYRSGLYQYVRHPSYSGMVLIFMAVALAERNWMAAAAIVLPTTAALLYRIHVEEAALLEAFGDSYSAYCRTTKRLVPGVY